MVDRGQLSEAVLRLQQCLGEIRGTAWNLFNLNGELTEDLMSGLIGRVTVPQVQEEARALAQRGEWHPAVRHVIRQLSEWRRRASRVLCSPFVMMDTVVAFIEHPEQDPPGIRKNSHPLYDPKDLEEV